MDRNAHWVRRGTRVVLFVGVCALLCAVAPAADAAFTRAFERTLTAAPGEPIEYLPDSQGASAGGVAVDSSDRVWAGSGEFPNIKLIRFGPAFEGPGSQFQASLPTEAWTDPASLAIDDADKRVFETGRASWDAARELHVGEPTVEVVGFAGEVIERWRRFGNGVQVAVDTSQEPLRDPSACDPGCVVYVSHDGKDAAPPKGDGLPVGVERLSAVGEPLPFAAAKGLSYISEGEIVGVPTGSGTEGCAESAFREEDGSPGAIAVDESGDLYVAIPECGTNAPAVIEYRPSGEFLQVIRGAATPGVAGRHDFGGFGGEITGLAYDRVSDHLLVAVTRENVVGGKEQSTGAVDEFAAEAGMFVAQVTETANGEQLAFPSQLATDSHGDLYVSDVQRQAVDIFGPGRFLPTLRVAQAATPSTTTATLLGEVNPEALQLSGCKFEYVTDAVFKATGFADLSSGGTAECEPGAGAIPPGGDFVSVSAGLSGLSSGTTYRFRLLATSSGELGGAAASRVLGFTAPHAPSIGETAIKDISAHFATVTSEIAPLGRDTEYWFEYVPQAKFSETGFTGAAETPHVSLGQGGPSGDSVESVLTHLSGLEAGASYEVRVVAANTIGETDGASLLLGTVSAPVVGLPDGRQYELVTPAQKDGGSDMFGAKEQDGQIPLSDLAHSSRSGEQLVLETHSGFGPFPSSEASAYVFTRTATGWGFQSLAAESLGVQNIGSVLTSPTDFSTVAIEDVSGSVASEPGQRRTSLVGPPGGPYVTVHADPPEHAQEAAEDKRVGTLVLGGSEDMRQIIFSGADDLCPGASHVKAGRIICDWNGTALSLVAVNNSGSVISNCGAVLGDGLAGGRTFHAVSADGDKIFFTAPDPSAANGGAGCWNGGTLNSPQLYMRTGEETVELSAPESGVVDPDGQKVAEYAGASKDGRRVFFLTRTELTAEAHALGLHDRELYEYDTVNRTLARVSRGSGTAGNVMAVPAVSDDGSTVYFLSFAALAAGAEAQPETPAGTEGTVNLYRYDTATKATTFVAPISRLDYTEVDGACAMLGGGSLGPATSLCPSADWQSSPDGRFVLFDSSRSLAGAVTATSARCVVVGTQGVINGHCDQVYRYDAASEGIACVSCNPSGAAPESNATFAPPPDGPPFSGPAIAMSDSGEYVFFQTKDALVPQDTNNTLDVYEWHDGKISLLSGGTSTGPSFFLSASSDGRNVFFGTHARLVAADTDSDGDVYDARICSSAEPCLSYSEKGAEDCEGAACQPVTAGPLVDTPDSLHPAEEVFTVRAAGKATVTTHAARGVRFLVTVATPAGGVLTLSGNLIRYLTRKVSGAGTYRIRIELTMQARKRLARRHELIVPLRLRFTEAGVTSAAQTNATVKVTAR